MMSLWWAKTAHLDATHKRSKTS